jgi:L-asparagine oxygenase
MSLHQTIVRAGPQGKVLSPDEAVATLRVARTLVTHGGTRIDGRLWIELARELWCDLPTGLQRTIRAFRRDSGDVGALALHGLPVDAAALPDTPRIAGSTQRTPAVPAALLSMISTGLGDPAAYAEEKSGALVQDVVPVPGQEEFSGNAGSLLLEFHTENAFHPHRPDYILLMCLRPDHDRRAALRIGSVRLALPLLEDEDRRILSQPLFVTAPPPSFGSAGGGTPPHPVLGGDPADPDLRVDFDATRGTTAAARAALHRLVELLDTVAAELRLETGDLAIVDNRIAVHGRTAFRPRYDGRDRWLQRTFALTDLRRSRAMRRGDSHVLVSTG